MAARKQDEVAREAHKQSLAFEHVATPHGWLSPGRLEVDADGNLTDVRRAGPDACPDLRRGYALPAIPNLHSHAFQRAMAGHAERRSPDSANDSFWTWRTAMYEVASTMKPDRLEVVATVLFNEMVASGTCSVAEFHYLHHEPYGAPAAPKTAYAESILRAAATTGIAVTLCPVLYLHGGFDRTLEEKQLRFGHRSVAAFAELFEDLRQVVSRTPFAKLGLAFHSLRAVRPDEMHACIEALGLQSEPDTPIHIHIAEQTAEVEACVHATGKRPLRLLLDEGLVDARTCLVHATHLDASEREEATALAAVAGLCPTTEANLGDGIFELGAWLHAGGSIGIGSDSQICVDPLEELRLLEYSQRLQQQRRCIAASAAEPHVGAYLWRASVEGGARALGQNIRGLAVGQRADFVVLDGDHPRLRDHGPETICDAAVFSRAGPPVIREVWRAGERLYARDLAAEHGTAR